MLTDLRFNGQGSQVMRRACLQQLAGAGVLGPRVIGARPLKGARCCFLSPRMPGFASDQP
jgi:hypothetical protein